MALQGRMIVAILMLSEITSAIVHPIVPHGNSVWALHIHLHQVPFILFQHIRHVLYEKYLTLSLSISLFNWLRSEIFLSDSPSVPVWNWYHFLLLLIIQVFLIYISFIPWLVFTGVTIRIYICPQIWHWYIFPFAIFSICLVGPSSDLSKQFSQRIFHQWSWNGGNLVSVPSTRLWNIMVDEIFYIRDDNSFNFITGLHRPS